MIPKTIIDLLTEDNIDLPTDTTPGRIDDIFIHHEDPQASNPVNESELSTGKKLEILDWAYMDRQLRSYGSNRIDDLSLGLMDKVAREHITVKSDTESVATGTFDFRSDSIPFAAKYNVAIALSYSGSGVSLSCL